MVLLTYYKASLDTVFIMSSGTLTQDGASHPFTVVSNGCHVSLNDSFGGGTAAIEKRLEGDWVPFYQSGVAESFTAPDDAYYDIGAGTVIRINLSGSTSPNLRFFMRNKA